MSLNQMEKCNVDIKKIIKAAKAGGAFLKKYFGESLETIQKSTAADFKTRADIESEAAILEVLTTEFPDWNINAEETGVLDKKSDYTFVVDPLDGTNNFVLGIPNFTVSIGLLFKNEIIAGVIYSPIIEHLYYAEKGKGSYFDHKRLRVNEEADITKATICEISGYDLYFKDEVKAVDGFYARDAKRVMANWSAAFDFCLLAAGRIEGIVNNASELHDFAAGKLIAIEAGAMLTDFNGNPESDDRGRRFIISNGTNIHRDLVEVMWQVNQAAES